MNPDAIVLFWPICLFVIMLLIMGFYCLLVTYNLIRALIGLELLIKAVTLLLVAVGYMNKHSALIEALVITLIVIEAVIIVVATGVIIGLHRQNNSLDIRRLRSPKG